jgi:hypothetical protein
VASSIFTVLSDANNDRQPDRTTGWASTIRTLVADLAEFFIIAFPFGLDRRLMPVEKGNLELLELV